MKASLLSFIVILACSNGIAGENPGNPKGELTLFAECADTDGTPEDEVSFEIYKDGIGQYFAVIRQALGDDQEKALDWIQLSLDWGMSTLEFTQYSDFWPSHNGIKLESAPAGETKDVGISLSVMPEGTRRIGAASGPMGVEFEKADLDCRLYIQN